jgi:hypothetical protein
MNGQPIAAQALGDAGLRTLASEHAGPRPAAVPALRTPAVGSEARAARATRP